MKNKVIYLTLFCLISCTTAPDDVNVEKIEFGVVFKGNTNGYLKTMMTYPDQDSVAITDWADTVYDHYLAIKITENSKLWDNFNSDFNFTLTTATDTESLRVGEENVWLVGKDCDDAAMYYFITVPTYIVDTIHPGNGILDLNYKSNFIKITYTFQYSHKNCDKVIYFGKGSHDYELVQKDKDNLVITYTSGDAENSITKNITLPKSMPSGTKISWVSNDSNIISNAGEVMRPSNGKGIGDVDVLLTATLSNGTEVAKKTFRLTVIGNNPVTGTLTDIDGNVYQTVLIGNQEWTVENLRTTRYANGSAIPLVKDSASWKDCNSPAYCYLNNTQNPDSIKKFGALYNWYVVNTGKVAPTGWHVPSDSDWTILLKYLINNGYGDPSYLGGKTNECVAKSLAAKTDWIFSKYTGSPGCAIQDNNRTGFSALPGKDRTESGKFENYGDGYWWSNTDYEANYALCRTISWQTTSVETICRYKKCGFSVRLVKDPTFTLTINATNGTVQKSPEKSFYAYGENVTLKAVPESGYHFLKWSGDISGTDSVVPITMYKNQNLTAVFYSGPAVYLLSIKAYNGSVIINPAKTVYDSGEVVTLKAVTPAGYCFTGWTGDIDGTDTITDVKMVKNKSISAHFSALFTLKTVGSNGTITKSPDKDVYLDGDTVILTATARSGYTFSYWSGDADSKNGKINIVMNKSKRIKANCTADSTDPVIDIDGNVYHTIRIGNQVWTVENLRTTKFNDGTLIQLVPEGHWTSLTTPAYCYCYTDTVSIRKYGALYNGYAVATGKLAPAGWHIPSDEEWNKMEKYLIMNGYNYDWMTDTTALNQIAKALAAKIDWDYHITGNEPGEINKDIQTNNSSGFSALPGGYCSSKIYGIYDQVLISKWWTITPVNGSSNLKCYYLSVPTMGLKNGYSEKYFGFSVRLVKD